MQEQKEGVLLPAVGLIMKMGKDMPTWLTLILLCQFIKLGEKWETKRVIKIWKKTDEVEGAEDCSWFNINNEELLWWSVKSEEERWVEKCVIASMQKVTTLLPIEDKKDSTQQQKYHLVLVCDLWLLWDSFYYYRTMTQWQSSSLQITGHHHDRHVLDLNEQWVSILFLHDWMLFCSSWFSTSNLHGQEMNGWCECEVWGVTREVY